MADSDNPWYYIWIGFGGALAEEFQKLDVVTKLDREIFINMLETFKAGNMREEMLASYLFLLYWELFGEKKSESDVAKEKNYIDVNFSKNIKIEDVAINLGLGRKYLSRIFKEEMGMSMQQYLISAKMKNAKKRCPSE